MTLTTDEPLDDRDIAKGGDISVVVDVPAGAERSDPAAKTPELTEEVRSLSQQVADAKAEAARLAASEAAARRETVAAQGEARDSHLIAISSAIEATNQQLDKAEADLATAHAAGDYKTAAKLQREMAKAELKLSELENGRVALEHRGQPTDRRETTEGRIPVQPQQQRQIATLDDAVEDLAGRVSPASASWLRAHKEVMREPAKLGAAHDYATKVRGLAQDTPEYFAFLDAELGVGSRQAAISAPQRATVAPARGATFDAPVSRDTPSLSTGQMRGRVVNLTLRQQDMAKSMDMTNEEYALFLTEDQPEGRAH